MRSVVFLVDLAAQGRSLLERRRPFAEGGSARCSPFPRCRAEQHGPVVHRSAAVPSGATRSMPRNATPFLRSPPAREWETHGGQALKGKRSSWSIWLRAAGSCQRIDAIGKPGSRRRPVPTPRVPRLRNGQAHFLTGTTQRIAHRRVSRMSARWTPPRILAPPIRARATANASHHQHKPPGPIPGGAVEHPDLRVGTLIKYGDPKPVFPQRHVANIRHRNRSFSTNQGLHPINLTLLR